MKLSSKFDAGTVYTFECQTRVGNEVSKEDAVPLTVNVDLSDATIADVIDKDLAVKFQGAVRKSFKTQGALQKWAEKRDNTHNVHVSRIGHKIESAEQLKAQILATLSTLPKEMQEEVKKEMGIK